MPSELKNGATNRHDGHENIRPIPQNMEKLEFFAGKELSELFTLAKRACLQYFGALKKTFGPEFCQTILWGSGIGDVWMCHGPTYVVGGFTFGGTLLERFGGVQTDVCSWRFHFWGNTF